MSAQRDADEVLAPHTPFLSTFAATDRLDGLFTLNTTNDTVPLQWEQVAGGGS